MLRSRLFKAATAVLLSVSMTAGFTACSAKPSEDSFRKAYDKKFESVTESIGQYYDLVDVAGDMPVSVQADTGITLSNDLLTLLESLLGGLVDLDWLNDVKFTLSEDMYRDLMSFAFGLSYGSNEIASAELILDSASSTVFMGVPVLSDTFIKMTDLTVEGISYGADVLPDEKALINSINSAYTIIMDHVDEVTFEEQTLVVNGIEQSCVAYKAELTQKDLAETYTDVLDLIKTNEDVKKLILDLYSNSALYSAYDSYGNVVDEAEDYSAEELYDEMILAIDDELFYMEDMLANGEITDDVALVWTSYITNKLEPIGTKLYMVDEGGSVEFYIAAAENKSNTGIEIYVANDGEKVFEIEGELVNDGKILSGAFDLIAENTSMLIVELENVDVKKLDKGQFVGSVEISPSKALVDVIGGELDSTLSMLGLTFSNLSFKIDVEKNDTTEIVASFSIMNGDASYLTLTTNAKVVEGGTVTLPENTTEVLETWLMDLDFNALVERAEDSGLPAIVVALLSQLAASMIQ